LYLILLDSTRSADEAELLNLTRNVHATSLPGPASDGLPSPISPTTSFLKSEWSVPSTVFDVVKFGGAAANGTVYDDDAIAKTLAAAKAAGSGAIAYFPPGIYKVNRTVEITGGGYGVVGSGVKSTISWGASVPPERAVVVVSEASGVLVEQLSFKSKYDTLKSGTNVTKLLHLGSSGGTASGHLIVDSDGSSARGEESFPPLAKGVSALYDGIYGGTCFACLCAVLSVSFVWLHRCYESGQVRRGYGMHQRL
jgi:hypothetical protein